MDVLKKLNDANLTAKFQKLCGVSHKNLEKCDQCKELYSNDRGPKEFRNSRCSKCRVKVPENAGSAVLFYILSYSSSLGNEVFYLLFYPYCVWNLDSVMIRKTALVWSLSMYIGQAGKDYFWWPRPRSPPVIRLETDFLQESSMPSTHAVSATTIPFMLAYYLLSRYEVCIKYPKSFTLQNFNIFSEILEVPPFSMPRIPLFQPHPGLYLCGYIVYDSIHYTL
jgi:hypothetical protein